MRIYLQRGTFIVNLHERKQKKKAPLSCHFPVVVFFLSFLCNGFLSVACRYALGKTKKAAPAGGTRRQKSQREVEECTRIKENVNIVPAIEIDGGRCNR